MIINRCGWCTGDALYEAYHDTEWGVPVYDDATLFEFLILETFQAGLSWITILRKRENFREALDNFDYNKIANYSAEKLEDLMSNPGIIRNKLKIKATVSNAQAFIKIQKEFGTFSKYIWGFVNHKPVQNAVLNYKEAPPTTAVSDALSKDLKKRGFKFTGSTVIYAHMQATGMVNDHEITCFRYNQIKALNP
ncbi:DNA-3-methyladenine glycosylase I [Leeuwenhoekiella sp. W20_SRS_FM14]|uniref:DNA-3-methyladenine glycosylase I n=1 Tax=Leeuwenhoekiella sp. W20_SRS_FM14 TaxID=3240270 RepID=UPI003F97A062